MTNETTEQERRENFNYNSFWFRGITPQEITDFRKEGSDFEKRYSESSGLLDKIINISEWSLNTADYASKESNYRAFTRLFGGIGLAGITSVLTRGIFGENSCYSPNLAEIYFTAECLGMFATGKLFPVGLRTIKYSVKIVKKLVDYVEGRK